ncbi:MAG: hypothetical protein JNK04_14600, partial [Myxococcales bacterium]|nr:hypothetical protein [Myxococcales bacterium]
ATMEIGLGGLASLEDDPISPPPAPTSNRPLLGNPVSERPALPSQSMPRSFRGEEPKKGVSPVVYVVLLLVLGGAAAGAWFAGLIPH